MPPPKKIDSLPAEIRDWLQRTLRERGFADYVAITEELNDKLAEAGRDETFHHATVHRFGQEFRQYAEMQARAQDEIRAFLAEASLKDEVDVTRGLFQQLTTIQWRLQMAMADPDQLPDPRGMKDLTTALNNLIRSTSLRDQILAAERKAMAEKLDAAAASGDLDEEAAAKARAIMGFA